MIRNTIASLLVAFAISTGAAPIQFDFKDPKGVNNIVFRTDAPLESINGTASGISGKVAFDPENPAATKGKIVVAASSLHVGNATMKEHLHGENWMNVSKHPEITFELDSLKNVRTEGNVTSGDAVGRMTMKGVTKELVTPVKLTYLKDKMKARSGKEGDLLVVRSNFSVKRSDFGINASRNEDKVSNEIELSLSVAGMAPKQ
jgi:polyisoprenoid-binding protein YceI